MGGKRWIISSARAHTPGGTWPSCRRWFCSTSKCRAWLRQIRADSARSRLPVVILTTSREEQDVAQSYDLGANSYIRKPVDFTQFAKAVEHLGLYWLVV